MTINPFSSNLIDLLSSNAAVTFDSNRAPIVGDQEPQSSFSSILTEAIGAASQADAVDKASALELLMGQNDDLAGLLLDAQKAELSLNLALQIRNKVIDAYNEIMRMQV